MFFFSALHSVHLTSLDTLQRCFLDGLHSSHIIKTHRIFSSWSSLDSCSSDLFFGFHLVSSPSWYRASGSSDSVHLQFVQENLAPFFFDCCFYRRELAGRHLFIIPSAILLPLFQSPAPTCLRRVVNSTIIISSQHHLLFLFTFSSPRIYPTFLSPFTYRSPLLPYPMIQIHFDRRRDKLGFSSKSVFFDPRHLSSFENVHPLDPYMLWFAS